MHKRDVITTFRGVTNVRLKFWKFGLIRLTRTEGEKNGGTYGTVRVVIRQCD
jgi:hypothetical protein